MKIMHDMMVIMNPGESDSASDEPLFWSNTDGWVSLETMEVVVATSGREAAEFALPASKCPKARWVLLEYAIAAVTTARVAASKLAVEKAAARAKVLRAAKRRRALAKRQKAAALTTHGTAIVKPR